MNPIAEAKLKSLGFRNLDEYYDSQMWSDFRNYLARRLRKIRRWHCWACKCGGDRFDFHHIRYHNLACCNKYEAQDIRILCKHCHSYLHKIQKERNMTLREATEYVLNGNLIKEKSDCIIKRI